MGGNQGVLRYFTPACGEYPRFVFILDEGAYFLRFPLKSDDRVKQKRMEVVGPTIA